MFAPAVAAAVGGQPGQDRLVIGPLGKLPGPVQVFRQKAGVQPQPLPHGHQSRAQGADVAGVVRHHQVSRPQFQDIHQHLRNGPVGGHAPGKEEGLYPGQFLHDRPPVVPDHGIGQAQQGILHRGPPLLVMGDVGLGENAAPSRDPGDGPGPVGVIRIILHLQVQPRQLLLQKGAGPGRAAGVDGYFYHRFIALLETGHVLGALGSDLDNRTGVLPGRPGAFHQGLNIVYLLQGPGLGQPLGSASGHRPPGDLLRIETGKKILNKVFQDGFDSALVGNVPGEYRSRFGLEQSRFDGKTANIQTQTEHLYISSRQPCSAPLHPVQGRPEIDPGDARLRLPRGGSWGGPFGRPTRSTCRFRARGPISPAHPPASPLPRHTQNTTSAPLFRPPFWWP